MKRITAANNTDFSNEMKFLLSCLSTKEEVENVVPQADVPLLELDWNAFIKLAIHHRVFPLVYKRVQRLKHGEVPATVVESLRLVYQQNVFSMLKLSGETEKIAGIFKEHGIRPLFLKGPVLGSHLYEDISLRTSSDLDILVPINDLNQAEEILRALGYQKDDYIESILNDWKWRHHHITFFHPQKKIKVEIHWRLNPGPAREPNFTELWERKSLSSLSKKQQIFTLGPEDLFLFLVTHGARHGWSRLRWLVDIERLQRKALDWQKVKNLLSKYRYTHLAGQALNLCSSIFYTEIAPEMKALATSKQSERLANGARFYLGSIVNLHSEPVPVEISLYHKKYLFQLMSSRQKLLFILSFLFPYPEDAQTLPLPKYLHLLYFPLRPFLWAWRRSRKRVLS